MVTETLGFIGLGNMGGPMVANLATAGFRLSLHDKAGSRERVPEGAAIAASPGEVARAADIVFLSLPDGDACQEVGREIATTPGRTTTVVVDFSTTGVAAAREIARGLAEAGIIYADAPVSGGKAGAVAGSLTVMWSGSAELLQRLRPALDAVAKNIFHVGTAPGQGQAMKLLNNFLSGTALAATSEAVAYGETQGLDPRTVVDVLNASTGRNTATSDKFPNRILSGTFDCGFQTALMAKDLRLYVESARTGGSPLDIAKRVAEIWQRADSEMPDSDCTRIYELICGPRRGSL